ncbi:MAG: CHASE3 domain-containing protein [Candidatus Obscuribacterales bacterium]|nr:CHASE3 domain-containing protein [Candidatus Obscuribacterales bacterium]
MSLAANKSNSSRRPVKVVLCLALFSIILLLIGCGFVLYQNQEKLYRQRQIVQRSREVISRIQYILIDLKDAENWQRGYLVTGKDKYLVPYAKARERILPSLKNLQESITDNQTQKQLGDRLESAVKERLFELDDTVAERQNNGFAAASKIMDKRVWQGARDKTRLLISHLKTNEEQLLQTKISKLEQEAALCLILIEVFSFLIVILGLVASATVLALWSRKERAERKFRAVFDQTLEFIGIVSPDGILVDVNKTALNAIGAELKDVTGKPFWETPWWTHSPKEQELLKESIKEARNGSTAGFEASHITESGPITVDFSINPVRDEDGKVILLVPEGRNISDRKKLETVQIVSYKLGQILEAEDNPLKGEIIQEILQLACQTIHWEYGGLWRVDEKNNRLFCASTWSESSCNLSEFENISKDLNLQPGIGLPGQVYVEEKSVWLADVCLSSNFPRAKYAVRLGLHAAVAVPIKVAGKVIGVMEFFSLQIFSPQSETINLIESIGNQIGLYLESKIMERESADLQDQLLSILSNMNDGVFQLNDSGQVIYANPAAITMIGCFSDQVIGKEIHELIRHEQDDCSIQSCALKQAIISGLTYRSETDFLLRMDNTLLPIEQSYAPVLKHGKASGSVLTFRDISKRKEAEKRVSEFYSIVSHELRTPLTSIRGAFGLLEGGKAGELSPKAQHLVSVGRTESERLVRLINDILDIRKIEAGQLELKIREIEATNLLTEAVTNLNPLALEAGVKLSLNIEKEEKILGDKDRLLQVLTNLISNAIKYSEPESCVNVLVRRNLAYLRFSVSDKGPGIRPSDLNKLFRMFQQVDSSDTRQKGGTGLGLATSKSIVELHGGKIGVDTELNKGSTFWFEIPLTGQKKTKEENISNSNKAPSGQPRILIVEDDLATREIMLQQLSALDVDFLLAADGNQALDMARTNNPDLIILDLGLPNIDGFEVVNILKNERNKTALLVYTARDLTNDEKVNLQLGISEHLTKSRTSESEFLQKVRLLLDGLLENKNLA